MNETVGIGIIGTGFARRVQIPAFLKCKGAAITSVSSGSLDNARLTASEFAIEHFSGDWRETASHPAVDLVCITTPPSLHKEMALFAISQGKHVLCEKPMAMNVAEAEAMNLAASSHSLLALIDHELRFQPGRRLAYTMLREGKIGKIRHAKAIFQAPHRGDPNVPWNWWSEAEEGGGALGAIGSHILDSFNWLLGTGVSSISCQLQTHVKSRRDSTGHMRAVTADDESNMLLRFHDSELTDDATGLVSISMSEYPRYKSLLEIFGTSGAMRIGQNGELDMAKADENDWTRLETDLGQPIQGVADTGFSRAFMQFAPEIILAIRSGKGTIEHAATFDDGVLVQKVLDAACESNSSGKTCILPNAT